jgi:hypothetical protein
VWREARQVEEGHLLHTVEDHCSQTHLSIDEGLDEACVVRSDTETWMWQDEVKGGKPLHFLKPWLKGPVGVDQDTSCS